MVGLPVHEIQCCPLQLDATISVVAVMCGSGVGWGNPPDFEVCSLKMFSVTESLFLFCLFILFCFVDSIVDRYVFIAILLFIFLILLKKTL